MKMQWVHHVLARLIATIRCSCTRRPKQMLVRLLFQQRNALDCCVLLTMLLVGLSLQLRYCYFGVVVVFTDASMLAMGFFVVVNAVLAFYALSCRRSCCLHCNCCCCYFWFQLIVFWWCQQSDCGPAADFCLCSLALWPTWKCRVCWRFCHYCCCCYMVVIVVVLQRTSAQ